MRSEEHRWFFEHLDVVAQYMGEWIAVSDGQIVSHGKDFEKVVDEGKKRHPNPLVIWVRQDIAEGGEV